MTITLRKFLSFEQWVLHSCGFLCSWYVKNSVRDFVFQFRSVQTSYGALPKFFQFVFRNPCLSSNLSHPYSFFAYYSSLMFSLRNRKHVPCFYRVIQTRVEVWEGTRAAGECFHSFFEFSQTFTSVCITR